MFDLSDLRSIYLNKEYLELKEEPENTLDEYKPLDDLLGRLRNLEELDINTIRSDSDYFDEVCLGHGQLIAETLRKVRQRCSLKISYGVDRQPVCWRHLFEQDVVVEDRNDYRERARNRWNQRKRDQLECEERKVMTGKVKREEERKKEEKERREEERKEKEEELWKEVSKWIKWEEEEEEEEGILPTISQAGSYNSWTYLCMSPHFDERQNPLMGAPPAPFGRGPENPPFVISSPYPVERHNPSTYLLRPPNFVTEEIPLPSASTGSSVFSDWMGSGPTEEFDRWPHLHSGGGVNIQLTNFLAPADFSEGVDPPRGSFSVFLDWPDSGPGEEFDRWLHDLWDARGGDAVQY